MPLKLRDHSKVAWNWIVRSADFSGSDCRKPVQPICLQKCYRPILLTSPLTIQVVSLLPELIICYSVMHSIQVCHFHVGDSVYKIRETHRHIEWVFHTDINTGLFVFLSRFCRYQHYTVCTACTIDCCGGSIFQNRKAFNVLWVNGQTSMSAAVVQKQTTTWVCKQTTIPVF